MLFLNGIIFVGKDTIVETTFPSRALSKNSTNKVCTEHEEENKDGTRYS